MWSIAAGYNGFEDEARYWMIFTRPGRDASELNAAIDVYEFARRDAVWHLISIGYNAGLWSGKDYYLRGIGSEQCGDCYDHWERWEGS